MAQTTFFSYSRADSAFVLKLAKDLRSKDIPLWLDQLDIKGGSRWGASIEAALRSSSRLIVVLTVTSVASENVMDEVSFALENGKYVIPVLLSPCEIPFRLRRLQHIDFTGDYRTGLNRLVHLLTNDIPAKATNEQSLTGLAEGSALPQNPQESKAVNLVTAPAASSRNKAVKRTGLVVVALVIAGGVWWLTQQENNQSSVELVNTANDTLQQDGLSADDGSQVTAVQPASDSTATVDAKPGADTIYRYYDSNWKESDPGSAFYYGKIYKEGDLWICKDYWVRSNSLQMVGSYLDKDLKTKMGTFKWYYENGQLEKEGKYDGERTLSETGYDENGNPKE